MNYYDIKILHIFFAVVMIISSLSLTNTNSKLQKVLFGAYTLASIITGFIIAKRFGIKISSGLPLWITIKTSIWLVIAVMTPLIVKRLPTLKKFIILPWTILLFVSIAMAVYKPMSLS